jgi:hypothetical protein
VQIRNLPPQAGRVDTGVVQFGNDWPGIFVRGDAAIGASNMLRGVAESVPRYKNELLRLATLLASCDVSRRPDLKRAMGPRTNG